MSFCVHVSAQEFFSEDLWQTLPVSWQAVLQDLSYQQIADLLLDAKNKDRRCVRITVTTVDTSVIHIVQFLCAIVSFVFCSPTIGILQCGLCPC